MLTTTAIEILKRAVARQLPKSIDKTSPNVDLRAFKELLQGRLVQAIDASADDWDCYLEPAITLSGREQLSLHAYASRRKSSNLE